MMDVWIVTDRYESDCQMDIHLHMTPKGAYEKAFGILHELYGQLVDRDYDYDGDWNDPDRPLHGIEEEMAEGLNGKLLLSLVRSENYANAKLEDLQKVFQKFNCIIGEWTDWDNDVDIKQARLSV